MKLTAEARPAKRGGPRFQLENPAAQSLMSSAVNVIAGSSARSFSLSLASTTKVGHSSVVPRTSPMIPSRCSKRSFSMAYGVAVIMNCRAVKLFIHNAASIPVMTAIEVQGSDRDR